MPVSSAAFWNRLMQALGPDTFTLLDIGCSGGIHESWLEFGTRLRAFGFDPNLEEVARLNATRPHAGIEYISGFVGLQPEHPFQEKRQAAGLYGGNHWDRLAIARSLQIRQAKAQKLSNAERTAQNHWHELKLADPARPIRIPEFVRQRNLETIDFIKLDIDGLDFDVMHSIEPLFASHDVLGFQMEVNFCGRASDADHTFHNTDRFMRQAGYELLDLTINRYSLSTLPRPYLYTSPAQSTGGRPYQGDALYVRDRAWIEKAPLPAAYPASKLVKLAAIYSLRGLDDHAAEVLARLREHLEGVLDVTAALDELAAAAMADERFGDEPRTFERYMQLFEQDDPRFYRREAAQPPQPAEESRWRRRLGHLVQAVRGD
jgi:Methyltransferase FkbM domain